MNKKRNQHLRMLLIAVAWLGLAGATTPVSSQDLVCCDIFREAYIAAFKDTFPKKICCDKFQEAVRTGKPCDPRADMDCDGKPNQSDADSKSGFPNFNYFASPDGAPVAPFLGGEPDPPPAGKCDCKWELVKGAAICSPDGKQPHYYEARWKCPSTGNEKYTRTAKPVTGPCP